MGSKKGKKPEQPEQFDIIQNSGVIKETVIIPKESGKYSGPVYYVQNIKTSHGENVLSAKRDVKGKLGRIQIHANTAEAGKRFPAIKRALVRISPRRPRITTKRPRIK